MLGLQAVDDKIESDLIAVSNQREGANVERDGGEDQSDKEAGIDGEDDAAGSYANLTGKQKRLFELRLKMVRDGSACETQYR